MQLESDALFKYQPMITNLTDELAKSAEWAQNIAPDFDYLRRSLSDASLKLVEAMRPMLAISKVGDAQYVLWDYMALEFFESVIETDDVNVILQALEEKNNYNKSNDIIEKCLYHPFLNDHKRLFKQAIVAYQNGQYELAALGFVTVIDDTLTQASGMNTHKAYDRCMVILDKFVKSEMVSDKEYATISLFTTFRSTYLALYKPVPFDEDEPYELNRHWIVHGRTKRELTRLDCVKLLNFLYGIILSDKIVKAKDDLDINKVEDMH